MNLKEKFISSVKPKSGLDLGADGKAKILDFEKESLSRQNGGPVGFAKMQPRDFTVTGDLALPLYTFPFYLSIFPQSQ